MLLLLSDLWNPPTIGGAPDYSSWRNERSPQRTWGAHEDCAWEKSPWLENGGASSQSCILGDAPQVWDWTEGDRVHPSGEEGWWAGWDDKLPWDHLPRGWSHVEALNEVMFNSLIFTLKSFKQWPWNFFKITMFAKMTDALSSSTNYRIANIVCVQLRISLQTRKFKRLLIKWCLNLLKALVLKGKRWGSRVEAL